VCVATDKRNYSTKRNFLIVGVNFITFFSVATQTYLVPCEARLMEWLSLTINCVLFNVLNAWQPEADTFWWWALETLRLLPLLLMELGAQPVETLPSEVQCAHRITDFELQDEHCRSDDNYSACRTRRTPDSSS
jgi:hypothetical protein